MSDTPRQARAARCLRCGSRGPWDYDDDVFGREVRCALCGHVAGAPVVPGPSGNPRPGLTRWEQRHA